MHYSVIKQCQRGYELWCLSIGHTHTNFRLLQWTLIMHCVPRRARFTLTWLERAMLISFCWLYNAGKPHLVFLICLCPNETANTCRLAWCWPSEGKSDSGTGINVLEGWWRMFGNEREMLFRAISQKTTGREKSEQQQVC